MRLNNKLGVRHILVDMPSGHKARVTLPEGEFELPPIYAQAMQLHPVGKHYLKKMKPRKPRKTNADNVDSQSSEKSAGPERS